jgi:hypothetical protein
MVMPPELPHSEPAVFIGHFEHRSAESAIAAVAEVALTVVCAYGALTLWNSHALIASLSVGLTLVFLHAASHQIRKIVRNQIDEYRITRAGIQTVEGRWEWSEIKEVYAEGWREAPFVDMKFVVNNAPLDRVKPFIVRPRLDSSEYDRLSRQLETVARKGNPSIVLGQYHMPSNVG